MGGWCCVRRNYCSNWLGILMFRGLTDKTAAAPCTAPLSTVGHSLGGAVAMLCALRLLDSLPPALHATVACITFAAPPVGNAALAALVAARGWQSRLTNYMLPEDWVPGLLGFFARQATKAAAAAATGGKFRAGAAHERLCWGCGDGSGGGCGGGQQRAVAAGGPA